MGARWGHTTLMFLLSNENMERELNHNHALVPLATASAETKRSSY